MTTNASILVVDDEPSLLDYIQRVLEQAGFRVLTACDGVQALRLLESRPVDLILTDIAMPRMNGYQLHKHVVGNPCWVKIPFLFLTARAQDSDVRFGKELGVDDYLTKPFEFEDLLAAVRGRLRRAQQLAGPTVPKLLQPTPGAEHLDLGELQIDVGQHHVSHRGQSLKLSAREFRLLICLAQRPYEVVSMQELIQVTHGLAVDYAEASSLLRPLIRSLRRKLGYSAGQSGCIDSVRGIGYQLILPSD